MKIIGFALAELAEKSRDCPVDHHQLMVVHGHVPRLEESEAERAARLERVQLSHAQGANRRRVTSGVRAMKKHIEILTLGLLITASSSMATTIVTFASGQASVPLPSSYRVTTGDDGLVATFGKGGKHKLEISLTGLLSADRHENDLGAKFVLDQASKRNIKVSSTPGRAVLMEPGGDTQVDATTYRSVHWQIGAANCVFTMTVTAPVPLSSDLDDFLDGPLNDIVANLGCKKL